MECIVLETLKASQVNISATHMRRLVDHKAHRGHELFHTYRALGLSTTHQTDVAAGLGVPALAALTKAGIPGSCVSAPLSEVVYEGLAYLAHDETSWRFEMPQEKSDTCRAWLINGTQLERRHRLQALLGFQGRRFSRYLLISGDRVAATTNDLAKWYEQACEPLVTVVDAHALANRLRAELVGTLFTLALKPTP